MNIANFSGFVIKSYEILTLKNILEMILQGTAE